MRNPKFFVKFVPWNQRTMSHLIDKTAYFATVLEFNDFNELRYISCVNMRQGEEYSDDREVEKIVRDRLHDADFIKYLLEVVKMQATEGYLEKVRNCINAPNKFNFLKENGYVINWLAETLAFSSVGILCLSDASVFNDDSAQLMFAHYAQNNTGLALVYEYSGANKAWPIEYTKKYGGSSGAATRILNWYKGDFKQTEMRDFLLKSEKWGYEKEHRIFAKPKPSVREVKEFNLELKAIFCTPKFDDFDTLNNINNAFYHGKDKMVMHKIFPSKYSSDDSYLFHIYNSNGKETVGEYLKRIYQHDF